jgi:hypothetical protein
MISTARPRLRIWGAGVRISPGSSTIEMRIISAPTFRQFSYPESTRGFVGRWWPHAPGFQISIEEGFRPRLHRHRLQRHSLRHAVKLFGCTHRRHQRVRFAIGDDCGSIKAPRDVNSLAASVALKKSGVSAVASYLKNKGDSHETYNNRTSTCIRSPELIRACAGWNAHWKSRHSPVPKPWRDRTYRERAQEYFGEYV